MCELCEHRLAPRDRDAIETVYTRTRTFTCTPCPGQSEAVRGSIGFIGPVSVIQSFDRCFAVGCGVVTYHCQLSLKSHIALTPRNIVYRRKQQEVATRLKDMGEDALEERLRGATQVQAPEPYRLSRLIAVSHRQRSLSLGLKRQPRLESG
jgi:hypothetical protein